MDFTTIKQRIAIEDVIPMLNLPMKKVKPTEWRGACPACNGGVRSLCITKNKGFTCWAARPFASGSVLDLVCHIRGYHPKREVKKAADELAAHFGLTVPSTVPQEQRAANEPAVRSDTPPADHFDGSDKMVVDNHITEAGKMVNPLAPPTERQVKLQKVFEKLRYEHAKVQALGLTPEMARALGIGFSVGGTKANRILFPLYLNGELVDFVGYNPDHETPLLFSSKLAERL